MDSVTCFAVIKWTTKIRCLFQNLFNIFLKAQSSKLKAQSSKLKAQNQ
ncbi:hypothetical protein M565_ctg5P1495 [Vibrio cyclitrophicus FF75]|nr:hypothetical protein M565_ctg5P1495 [Vibrio cyclitrophicus FF75]